VLRMGIGLCDGYTLPVFGRLEGGALGGGGASRTTGNRQAHFFASFYGKTHHRLCNLRRAPNPAGLHIDIGGEKVRHECWYV